MCQLLFSISKWLSLIGTKEIYLCLLVAIALSSISPQVSFQKKYLNCQIFYTIPSLYSPIYYVNLYFFKPDDDLDDIIGNLDWSSSSTSTTSSVTSTVTTVTSVTSVTTTVTSVTTCSTSSTRYTLRNIAHMQKYCSQVKILLTG